GDARERYLELGTSWFQQPEEWAAMPAADGPEAWQRIAVQPDLSRRDGEPGAPGRRVDIVVPTEPIEPVALPDVTISGVQMAQDSIEFDVDRVGVPVLVKVGYFPNWQADGAEGPYRIGPNMMAVVPTDTHVELSYGRSAIDYLTVLLTLLGIGLCVFWRRQGDVRHAAEGPVGFGPSGATGRSVAAADDAFAFDSWSIRPEGSADGRHEIAPAADDHST
ncbi:MAG: hypothetical protein HKN41_08540, partial [Ilumatobacter sp.]|nr:hypothetical protein [Ilumatobacter sp.]